VRARVVHLPDPDDRVPDRRQDEHDDWPDGRNSARRAVLRGVSEWSHSGVQPPAPPVPVPSGRGGAQRIPRPSNARPGGPPPWADIPPELRRPSLADVRTVLSGLGPPVPSARERSLRAVRGDGNGAGGEHELPGISEWDVRPSAVLAPLYEEDGQAIVVLTRRTWDLRTHQGEVSFPGGRIEPGESPADAACREAKEEIDLDPSTVELIGELDHLTTVSSRAFIVPYVGTLPGRPDCRPNPREVEAVLHVPLAELADPAIYREELWTFPGGVRLPVHFFELVGDTVWGMTAALLRQLVGMVTHTLGRGDLGHP
jgi:8-oxo-dGTP pyrophosphatase MutT (NUDIX family)